jgi:hypothetical protein
MEYHPFRTTITNADSLTFEQVSPRQILEHKKLVERKAAFKKGVGLYAEIGKPSKVADNQRLGNRSKDTYS